jgi:ionotropic glutamate receptor
MTPFAGRVDHFMPIDEGVSRLRAGMFAFFTEESPIYKHIGDTFLEHEKCGLVDIEYVRFADPFLALPKNSPYREIMRVK